MGTALLEAPAGTRVPAPLAGKVVAIYARISNDKRGLAENVATQVELGTAYVQARWPGCAIEVYQDNDLTAADPDTFRPDYARLVGDVVAGRVLAVVSADQDRLTRQPSEWEALMPVLLASGINETHGYRDGVTSVELGKRSYGRFKSMMAAEYVEGIKVKVAEKLDKLARQGRPSGATVYGYTHAVEDDVKVLVVNEDQARIVAEVVGRLLAGESRASIALDLNARGERGAKGGRFTAGSVGNIVTNHTVAGKRVHRGDVYPALWPALVAEADWLALRARFKADRASSGRPGRRRHLLSGIAVCGCGTRMTGRRAGDRTQLTCMRDQGGCGQTVDGTHVEAHVTDKLLARLDHLAKVVGGADDHQARRDELTAQLKAIDVERDQNSDDRAADIISRDTFISLQRALDRRHDELSAELASVPVPSDVVDPEAVRVAWKHLETAERRLIVERYIERILIDQREPGARRRFDVGRVHIEGPGWSD